MDKSAMNQSVAVLKNERALSLAEAHRTKKLNSGKDVTPMKQAESGMVLAENGTEPAQAGKLSDAPVNPGANERVEVAAASTAVQIEASSGQEAALMAQNDAQPVLKAKPPVETETSQLQGTLSTNNITQLPIQGRNVMSMAKAAAPTPQTTTKDVTINVTNGVTNNVTNNAANGVTNHVTWLITAGVLQRSLDGGHSWQDVMQNDHTLLCYATNEQEVWAGGRAGTLFHSVDSGLTWVQVQPSIKARTLGSDVNHIELQGRLEIVVSTVSDEIWISRDGGRSWENRMPPEHSR
jgi:hypothetical protein